MFILCVNCLAIFQHCAPIFFVFFMFFINYLVFFSRFSRGKDRVFVRSSSCCGHLAAGS